MLVVKNIFCYLGNKQVLSDVSFQVEQGESLGITGPNGSGKSTILNVVSGVVRHNKGQILYNKRSISKLSIDARARQGIARTFQTARLFQSLRVGEYMGLGDVNIKKGQEYLSFLSPQVQLDNKISHLSVGQCRCVEIARMLSSSAQCCLFDEPFSGLSEHARTALIELLRSLLGTHSYIVVDHDQVSLDKVTTRQIAILDGKVEL